MAFDELLVQRGELQRGTVLRSGTGEQVMAWGTVMNAIPLLVRPRRVGSYVRLGLNEQTPFVIYVRPLEPVSDDPVGPWRMLVDGSEYTLVDPVETDIASRAHHWEIGCRRLS